ncbi:MAG: type II toxin-antitoxin system RelE/ParE family toxin [Elusimicrobia bacterium]|nr:type II toxin-antitoxin system RelE/ParE family toxin [Elusimicrobiota bacterium]
MAKYSIVIKKSAAKELAKIPRHDLRRILSKIQDLFTTPRPPGAQKFAHFELYRIRQGNYRIVYTINNTTIEIHIIKIGHRRDIYNF